MKAEKSRLTSGDDTRVHRPNPTSRGVFLLLFLAIILTVIFLALTNNYLMDDALITLRYSYNLGQKGHPIWNEADIHSPSMGYTTTLWMALNAMPAIFTDKRDVLIYSARVLSFLALVLIVVVTCRDIENRDINTVAKMTLVAGIFGQAGFAFHVNSGMETILFSCLALLAITFHQKQPGSWLSFAFGGLSFLTRPEGALIIGILVLDHIRKWELRRAAGFAFGFSLVVIFLGISIYSYYGDWLPNSFYIKQGEGINLASIKQTAFFFATIALPFVAASLYGALVLRSSQSTIGLLAAFMLIGYHLTVAPLMNVLSRYQWPALVLMIYASLPAFETLFRQASRYRPAIIGVVLSFFIINIGNLLATTYFATTTGKAMSNLIQIGKAMEPYRRDNQWLVYHDAGAICYFSNWNCFDTIGLNNREVAKGELSLSDILKSDNAAVVMQNIDLMAPNATERANDFFEDHQGTGYHYVDTYIVLREGSNREFGVMVFAKDETAVRDMFANANLQPNLKPQAFFEIYSFARRVVKNR